MNKTPGPWIVDEGNIECHDSYDVYAVGTTGTETPFICTVVSPHRVEDSRLIAAAPEMLEALIGIMKNIEIDAYKLGKLTGNDMDLTPREAAVMIAIERATGLAWEQVKAGVKP